MTPYEVLLSESQERMLIVVTAGREAEVQRVFERYDLHAATIGRVIAEPVVRCSARGEMVCEVPGAALADDAPTYVREGAPPPDLGERRAVDLAPLAAQPPSASDLLALLASPNVRSRRPIWRQYDHMNGTNTLVGPGAGDAALLRLKGTPAALAISVDGPGRLGALDPRLAGSAAVIEAALNVAVTGATPIGITNCLNFASPETTAGYWQLSEAIDGMADACRALAIPVVSGNVSLYNETPAGPILPTPVVGMIGLLDDRSRAVPMAWHDGDELWLLGPAEVDASSLAGSERAARDAIVGGVPSLDTAAAARLVTLLGELSRDRVLAAAHDVSIGGIAVAAARMAIAAGIGAQLSVAEREPLPTAAWFGERGGRVLVAVTDGARERLLAAATGAGVIVRRLGSVGGETLRLDGGSVSVTELRAAWMTPFAS